MDTEGSREESISARESFQIKLPISTKKKGNYKPNLSHFTIIKEQGDHPGEIPKSQDLQEDQAPSSAKKTKPRAKKHAQANFKIFISPPPFSVVIGCHSP